MGEITIQFGAATAGYKRGERAVVDGDDQRTKDLIEGGYAVEVDQRDEAPQGDPPEPPEKAGQASAKTRGSSGS